MKTLNTETQKKRSIKECERIIHTYNTHKRCDILVTPSAVASFRIAKEKAFRRVNPDTLFVHKDKRINVRMRYAELPNRTLFEIEVYRGIKKVSIRDVEKLLKELKQA